MIPTVSVFTLLRYVWTHPLNAGGRMAAIGRVVRWQAACRLRPGPIVLPFVAGTRLAMTRGMTGATGNWYCGLHEHREMAFALHVLRATDCFLDVGANVGSYSILAAGAVGARTIAVEPVPDTHAHLVRNVVLNALQERVRSWQGGLAGASGTLRFSCGLDTVNHVLASGEDLAAVEVPVMTLDALVGDDVPALIKIDVEGFEHEVLAGAQRTLADATLLAVILEVNGSGLRYGHADDALITSVRRHGFAPCSYDPFTRTLATAAAASGNVIFVRDLTTVRERIASAPRFALVNGTI